MLWKIFFYILFAFLFGLLNIGLANHLWRRYNASYLRSLFFFLIVFDLCNFLNWIGPKIVRLLFSGSGGLEFWKVYFVIIFFISPMFYVYMYLFLIVFLRLMQKKMPRGIHLLFISGLTVYLMFYCWLYARSYPDNNFSQLKAVMGIENTAGLAYMVLLPAVFLIIALFQKDDFKRRKNMAFIAAWEICVMVLYIVPLSWLQINLKNTTIDLLAFLFFLMPLLPLWVAEIFHRKSIRLYPAEETLPSLGPLFEKFGISPREGEVLEMVLAGKSQKEIESALFISEKTVKSHLYSAYKKLGVKNRIQLLNLRQNLKK